MEEQLIKKLQTIYYDIKEPEDVARYLKRSMEDIHALFFEIPENDRYVEFTIPKKNGGHREISAPIDVIKEIQRDLALLFQAVYTPIKAVNGFVYGRNVKTNASPHVGARVLLNIDLKDFFSTISYGMVLKLFKKNKYKKNNDVAKLFATMCCYKKRLPQGAPTSPVLSNMIVERMDHELIFLSKQNSMFYSRYADDLTFSIKKAQAFPTSMVKMEGEKLTLGSELKEIIEKSGFTLNEEKLRMATNKQRQIVTGLVVNKKCNVKRNYVRKLRSIIHDIETNGYDKAQEKHYACFACEKNKEPSLLNVIDGMVAYLIMIKGKSDPVCVNMYSKLSKYWPRYIELLDEVNRMKNNKDFFLCHASEDKDYTGKLYMEIIKNKHSAWLDEYEIKLGDSIFDKVNEGLKCSDYGVIIISNYFFKKRFAQSEMKSIFTMKKKVIPVFLHCAFEDFEKEYPLLADFKGHHSDGVNIKHDADAICGSIK